MKVEIWFDFTCPFSYMGLKRFTEALEDFLHKKEVKLYLRSYNLNPLVEETLNIDAYDFFAENKDLTVIDAKNVLKRLTDKFLQEGVIFDFDNLITTTSLKAHNLLKLIEDDWAKIAFINHVFVAHFEKGKDISKLEVLLEISKNISLKPEDVEAVYQTDMYANDVNNDFLRAEAFGLEGVPAFVVDESYYLMGSHSKEAYLEMLDMFYRKKANKTQAINEYCQDEIC